MQDIHSVLLLDDPHGRKYCFKESALGNDSPVGNTMLD
jgi:hypothetical protein